MSIAEALSNQDWEEIVARCEETEQLNASHGTTHEHCAEHILALLLLGDLPESMRVWHRIDEQAKSRAANVWNLADALQTRNRQAFFSHAVNSKWATQVEQAMVTELVDFQRRYTLRLISRAYSTVSLSTVANLLGIAVSEVPDLARANDWEVHDSFINISSKCRASANEMEPSVNRTARRVTDDQCSELQRLTEQVVRLQTT